MANKKQSESINVSNKELTSLQDMVSWMKESESLMAKLHKIYPEFKTAMEILCPGVLDRGSESKITNIQLMAEVSNLYLAAEYWRKVSASNKLQLSEIIKNVKGKKYGIIETVYKTVKYTKKR